MNKIVNYIVESKAELKKVLWPTRQQTLNHTLMVIAISLGLAFFLGLIDFGLSKLLELFIYQ